jgi:hypothetical protein
MRSVGLTNFGALLATGGRTEILEISYAFWQSKALLSAVELDVFTVIAGPSMRSQTPKQKSSEIPRAGPKEDTHE